MIFAEIGEYMEDGGLGLTRGLNLFEGFMPKDPAFCVALLHVPGEDDDRVFVSGEAGIAFEQPYFQIQVRAETYTVAIEKMRQIKALLNGIGNTKLPDNSGTLYGSILAKGNVVSWREDERELLSKITCAQVFQARKKVSAA